MKRGSPSWYFVNSAFFLILAAVAAEVLMRLTGVALLAPSDFRNRPSPDDAGKLRILAIGESTTADHFSAGGNGPWPRRLEKLLLQQGIPARVYNEGVGGTTTPLILSRLPGYVEMYDPHIVISMMGINDDDYFLYRKVQPSPVAQWLSQLRLVRMAERLSRGLRAKLSCHIEEEESSMPEFWTLVDKGFITAKRSPVEMVEKEARWWTQNPRDVALILLEVGVKLDEPRSRPYYDRAYELYPYQRDIAFRKLTHLAPGSRVCLDISRQLVQCGDFVPDIVVSAIAACARGLPEEAARLGLTKRGFFVSEQAYSQTKYHYRKIHEFLQQKGIHHMAMQYPTQKMNDLQGYFVNSNGDLEDRFKDLIFIDNEANFAQALSRHPYSDLFVDRFQNSWGHTTGLGHEMLAQSALSAVIQLMKSHPQLASRL